MTETGSPHTNPAPNRPCRVRWRIAGLLAWGLAASAGAAEQWEPLTIDKQGQWYFDAKSFRADGEYIKVTLKTRYPAKRDIPIRGSQGEVTRTIVGVIETTAVNAIDCRKRLVAVIAYSFFDDAGDNLGGGSGSREQWQSKLKEPLPGSTMSKVVEVLCSPGKENKRPDGTSTGAGVDSAQARPSSAPPVAENSQRMSGTGVIINKTGHVLTNFHVVDACKKILVFGTDRRERSAQRLGVDKRNDLALLQTEVAGPDAPALLRVGHAVRSGENVMAVGYPLTGILSSEANVSFGYVSATAGIGDDTSVFQLSAPIHKGNSGGPILDSTGLLVGLVTSKLNPVTTARVSGDIPQNIAFGIKSEVVQLFLGTQNVSFGSGPTKLPRLDNPELAALAKKMVVQVICHL